MFRRKMLQNKLNQKKFLAISGTERRKNDIPGSYVSLSFTIIIIIKL